MDLQPEILRYAALVESTPSAFANDVLAGTVEALRTGERPHAFTIINAVRRALGKPELTPPPETEDLEPERKVLIERVVGQAMENAARIVPVLREAKARGESYEQARPLAFGILVNDLTRDVGGIYDSKTTELAAAESFAPSAFGTGAYFQKTRHTHALFGDVYDAIFLDLMAREVVREVPAIFRPAPATA